jgi:uncharacterized protein (UPF0276 family)
MSANPERPAAHPAAHRPMRPPVGIGLRAPHYRDLLEQKPDLAFLEVHSENYFGDDGAPLYYLERARELYPVSLHGVGLSLGSSDPLNRVYLARLKQLIDRIEPVLVSDHLSWCSIDGVYLNDLLPLPYTEDTLDHFCARVSQVQDMLGRELLIENPSSYLQFADSSIPEWEFLAEVVRRSGCGLLLDVNNVYVSCVNHGFDAPRYLASLPVAAVREIHLAGHAVKQYAGGESADAPSLARGPRLDPIGEILIDTHGAPVSEPVWALYRTALTRFGARPTLVEWDNDLPPLAVLVDEALRAEAMTTGVADAA